MCDRDRGEREVERRWGFSDRPPCNRAGPTNPPSQARAPLCQKRRKKTRGVGAVCGLGDGVGVGGQG